MKFLISSRFAIKSGRQFRRPLNKRAVLNGKIKECIARLKAEMAEIGAEQKSIKEGQKQAREDFEMAEIIAEQKSIKEGQRQARKEFEEMQMELEQLRNAKEIISLQSVRISLRLNLMFRILKAKVETDSANLAKLTQSLRDLIASQTTK